MRIILLVLVLALSGCTTIHFDRGTDIGTPTSEKWHHNFALDLYEASAPVVLDEECGNQQWSSVKTELTFINGLARLANLGHPIWYPKTVEVNCK